MGSLGAVPVDTLSNSPQFDYKQYYTGPEVFLYTSLYLSGAVDPYNIEVITKADLQGIQELWLDIPEEAKIEMYKCKSIKQLISLKDTGSRHNVVDDNQENSHIPADTEG